MMARGTPWADHELAELAKVGPFDIAGLRTFRETFPHRSKSAIRSQLQVLRKRGRAADTVVSVADPFPKYRFD
jgi:hypothetical protein